MTKSELFAYAQKWAAGITKHAASLQLVRYPSAPLLSNLGNARQTELAFQSTRSVTLEASNVVKSARSTAVVFIEKARTALKPYLGDRWSTAWNQAGFTRGSLQIPRSNTAEVANLTRSLQAYLAANPAKQNSSTGVTATAAGALVTSLDGAVTTLNDAKSGQRTARVARDTSHATLTEYLQDSRKEVESAIDEDDARWMDFIDAVPGDLRAPEAVSALVAEPGLPGHVRLSFLPSLRAESYGVEVSHGAGQPFVNVTTVRDTVADLALTPGSAVRVRVRARNAAGQSAPSPVADVAVPVAEAA